MASKSSGRGGGGNILVDILKTSSHKKERAETVFRTIRNECENKIRRRLQEGGKSIDFDFPIVKPGLPTYDLDACVAYMHKRLRGRGLDTFMVSPRVMRISWDRALREARRMRAEEMLARHRKKREIRLREKRRKREVEKRRREQEVEKERGPPIPPNADDPGDLFSLPSVRNLKSMADVLRHV